jgi:hypothetical protein
MSMRQVMALDGSVQGIGCTKILLAIVGQFHQKKVGVCFAAAVIRIPGTVSPDRRFKYHKVRVEFVVGNFFVSGTVGEISIKSCRAEMFFKIFSTLRSRLSHRQGRKQTKY